MEASRKNTNKNRVNRRINRQQREEEEERLARQNVFRNDNRNLGFRRDLREIGGNPRSIRPDNEIIMPLRRNPAIPLPQAQPAQPPISFTHQDSSLANFTDQYVAQNVGFTGDWNEFKSQAKNDIVELLNQKRGNKVLFSANVKMSRQDRKFLTLGNRNIRTRYPKIITEDTDLNELYEEVMEELSEQMDVLQDTEGSGWVFEEVDKIDIHTIGWDPLRANKWLPLPEVIANKKAIINKDEECFKWSIARAISPTDKNPHRVDNKLKEVAKSLNMEGIEIPTPVKDITKFENQNKDFAVVVLGLSKYNKVYPIRKSEYAYKRKHLVILLMIKDENNIHYTLVNNESKLLSKQHSDHDGEIFRCWNCLNVFHDKDKLSYHIDHCSNLDTQTLKMPKPGTYLEFENHTRKKHYPFVIYCDIECTTNKMEYCDVNPETSYTTKIQKHEPISYTYILVSFDQNVMENEVVIYTGKDCMEDLVINLEMLSSKIYNLIEAKPILNREDKENYIYAKECHVCHKPYNNKNIKVKDHCYYTGRYLGASHIGCRSYRVKFIPIFFHNLSSYDSHLFITNLASKINGEKLNCIPNNEQKYISFTKDSVVSHFRDANNFPHPITFQLRFVDSFKFMGSSLATLATNLPDDKYHNLERRFSGRKLELAKRKGVFPYDWFDTIDKLKVKSYPPKDAFYSALTGEGITDEEYEFGKEVWNTFGCENLQDYLELYNEIDVLLLADIFENFRNICLENYKIDPAYYYTSPGLFWDAMLKETKVKLELLSDIDMYYFFKRMIRGGISMISNRYAEANNPYMGESYNPEKETSYIVYYDDNNLYGFIMTHELPYEGFKWMMKEEMEYLFNNQTREEWEKTPCALEVSLEYPKELHDLHNDLPLCPEKMETKNKINKLIPNLNDKEKYVIHYKTLLFVLSLGLILKKIYNGIKFKESNWMKSYIDKNTRLRTLATNDFEKDFFKLGNNSVFGKTTENELNRCTVELVTSSNRLSKLSAKTNFKGIRIFNENLVSVHMSITEVKIKKPIYVGAAVLDMSKLPMYDFHYNYIKKNYGNDASLLFMDTDSLTYHIKTKDIYKDMSKNVNEIFDTSNYPKDHPSGIKSGINKKVPGKFKDELGGKIITEFVGLRPKLYSFVTMNNVEEKKCKGIRKTVVKNKISFNNYKKCLFEKSVIMKEQYNIRSYDHQLFTEKQNKVALSPFDDKRYILEDGIHTLAWGHYKIKD